MLSLQEIFDRVVAHLRAQQTRAMSDRPGLCAYRGVNGTKCAVGVLIPDELYQPRIEGSGVSSLIDNNTIIDRLSEKSGILRDTLRKSNIDVNDRYSLKLLRDLQYTHDEYSIDNWETSLEAIAKRHGLVYTPKG